MDKRRAKNAFTKYVLNPVVKPLAGRLLPGWALLETTGRKSGEPRRNPVGDGLRGDVFWIVSEDGRKAGYVKNLVANPRVRVRTHGRWRTGTARVLDEDDALTRQKRLKLNRLNAFMVRSVGVAPTTIRIDLDPG